MNGRDEQAPRYCATCGALVTQGAAVCGECGARFRESPYSGRATDAPGAWSRPPVPRRGSEEHRVASPEHEDRIELVSRESLRAPRPGATTMRGTDDQYDQRMTSSSVPPTPDWSSSYQSPAQPAQAWSAPAQGGAPAPSPSGELEPPLDGCAPASLLARIGAALLDGVVTSLVGIPLFIGVLLLALNGEATLLTQILIGVGVVLQVAVWLVLVWLQGSRALTPGKALLGLRTVRWSTGRPIGFLRALGRSVLLSIPLVQLVMVIPILLDARTHRGLHDRAMDSIVLGIRTGRNPLVARPDDYARHADSHYLPQQPVPVTTHDNLLSQPGAAWGVGATGSASSSATGWEQSAAPAVSDGVIERSPWAPSGQAPAAPSQQAAPQQPVPQQAAPQQEASPWGVPPQPQPSPSPAGWGSPAPAPAEPESSWMTVWRT